MSPANVFQRFGSFLFSKDFLKKRLLTIHLSGPVSNFGIPVAAVMDIKKDPTLISGPMTGSLIVYSLVFMKYSMSITPVNYLLFGCHLVNECAQLAQGFRYVNYWNFGGRERTMTAEGAAAGAAAAAK
ncbi:hypothetical protein BZA70DRAFT_279741 [Myxozyma melibiosi]|uniref:Mitochondrial pyruvate carrier n=1 Tax=Myxozyma melibiosi TaxID=54550 RepID=A0ABR1F6E1_9ASCO